MRDFFVRYNKRFTLSTGFFFGVLGTGWSYFYVDQTNLELQAIAALRAEAVKQEQALSSAAYDYFLANQQADLIFVLSLQASARSDLVKLIYKGNMLDRATPVRNMIGTLALAGQLDYRTTYDAYAALNEKAREAIDFSMYTQVKDHEREIIKQGEAYANTVHARVATLDQARAELESRGRSQRLAGIAFAMFGNFVLLCANLIADRRAGSAAALLLLFLSS